jgi:hypothetical protein
LVIIYFDSPGVNQIISRVSQILAVEKFELSNNNLVKIIESTHGDFRQV